MSYTDTTGIFTETSTNSAGHATVEPYNYISETDYRTEDKRKGGLYTPSKVLYEKVQVVKEYQPANSTKAPYGYTAYKFTTPHNFPNPGIYGDVDNSWRYGLLTDVNQFDAKGKKVTSKKYVFDYHVFPYEFGDSINLHDIQSSRGKVSFGWARLKEERSTMVGVTAINKLAYADELLPNLDAKAESLYVTQSSTSFQKVSDPYPWPCADPVDIAIRYDNKSYVAGTFGIGDPQKLDAVSVVCYDDIVDYKGPDNFCDKLLNGMFVDIKMAKDIDISHFDTLNVPWTTCRRFDLFRMSGSQKMPPGIDPFGVSSATLCDADGGIGAIDLVINY
jgi:hypothetical protein